MFRTYLGKFGETCSFPWSNHCNITKVGLNPSMPWSWVCPPGQQQRLPWFCQGVVAVGSTHRELCMPLVPGVSPGHSDPSHSLSVVLPNLSWTPRLRKSPCRGSGRTWCRQSIHHVQRNSIQLWHWVAEWKKNNQGQDHSYGFSAITLISSDTRPNTLKQWFTDDLQEQLDELFGGQEDLCPSQIQCLLMLPPYLGQFIWVWCFPTWIPEKDQRSKIKGQMKQCYEKLKVMKRWR